MCVDITYQLQVKQNTLNSRFWEMLSYFIVETNLYSSNTPDNTNINYQLFQIIISRNIIV